MISRLKSMFRDRWGVADCSRTEAWKRIRSLPAHPSFAGHPPAKSEPDGRRCSVSSASRFSQEAE